jgi:hypothetical protein
MMGSISSQLDATVADRRGKPKMVQPDMVIQSIQALILHNQVSNIQNATEIKHKSRGTVRRKQRVGHTAEKYILLWSQWNGSAWALIGNVDK